MATSSKSNTNDQAEKARLVITSAPVAHVVTGPCSICESLFIRDDGYGDRLLDDFAEHIERVHRASNTAQMPAEEGPL